MIEFRPLTLADRAAYERCLAASQTAAERGCEYSFANVYLWGSQQVAFLHGQVILLSQFGDRLVYPYPLGAGDKRAALDAILADAAARGIPFRLTGLVGAERKTLEALYPGRFRFEVDPGTHDYVYAIDDLAELRGKKYHGKRNHCHRFAAVFPDHTVEELNESNLHAARCMADRWYEDRIAADPEGDYQWERAALERALNEFQELNMEGLILRSGEEVLAITLGSRLSGDTFDVQFEKARADADGAYAMINRAFARHLLAKYPEIKFLDREEDMGLEGLRRAKQSYHPHHMIEKCRAFPVEVGDDDD